MRSLLFPFLLLACAQPAPPPGTPEAEPFVQQQGSVQPLPVDSDTTASAKAAVPNPRPELDEGCVEHIDASPAGARMVLYAAKDAMKTREAELESTLASAWMMAEQSASVSIADDFERGIATEHTDMPDTLDVTITYFARCSSRSPHTMRAYRVWRAAEGGYGWRER